MERSGGGVGEGGVGQMKITDVRTVVVNAQMRNWVFVKVETDEPGLFGWGEASLEWKTRAVVGAVEEACEGKRAIDLAEECIEKGYTAVKVVFVPYSEPLIGVTAIKKFASLVRDLREAVGDAVDVMIDFHGRTSPAAALQLLPAIEEYHPFFCEEVVPPENIDALLTVRRQTRIPLATGERRATRFEFREIFEKQAVDVIQPDLCHCGGLLEAKKIAAIAETYYIGVAPHNPLGPVANAAALHFALSTPNFLIQEDMLADVPWRWEVVQHSLQTRDGYWLKSESPGLGVEV